MHVYLQCKLQIYNMWISSSSVFPHQQMWRKHFTGLIRGLRNVNHYSISPTEWVSQGQEQGSTLGQRVWISCVFTILEGSNAVFPVLTKFISTSRLMVLLFLVGSDTVYFQIKCIFLQLSFLKFIYLWTFFDKGITKIWYSDWPQKF